MAYLLTYDIDTHTIELWDGWDDENVSAIPLRQACEELGIAMPEVTPRLAGWAHPDPTEALYPETIPLIDCLDIDMCAREGDIEEVCRALLTQYRDRFHPRAQVW